MVCSLHFEKVINPRKARVRVVRLREAIDQPIACKHCVIPRCKEACQVDAISITAAGMVVIDEQKCDGCGDCVDACPFGAIRINPFSNKAILCTLCGECVKHCPVNCMYIITPDGLGTIRRYAYTTKRHRIKIGSETYPREE